MFLSCSATPRTAFFKVRQVSERSGDRFKIIFYGVRSSATFYSLHIKTPLETHQEVFLFIFSVSQILSSISLASLQCIKGSFTVSQTLSRKKSRCCLSISLCELSSSSIAHFIARFDGLARTKSTCFALIFANALLYSDLLKPLFTETRSAKRTFAKICSLYLSVIGFRAL